MRELTAQKIRGLLDKRFMEIFEDIEWRQVMRKKPLTGEEHDDYLEILDSFKGNARQPLRLCNYREVSFSVDKLLQEHEIELEKESFSYRKFCKELLKLNLKLMEIEKQSALGLV